MIEAIIFSGATTLAFVIITGVRIRNILKRRTI